MSKPLLPEELAGEFFPVGSVGGKRHELAMEYVKQIKLPYTFQLPAFKEEDMIRQFGVLVEGFEEEGNFTLDVDLHTYRTIVDEDEPITPDELHFRSLYLMIDGTHYPFLKTQQTAPATMGFSIRGSDGKQLLSRSLLRFFSSLMKRIGEGQKEHLQQHADLLFLCQDDPALGHVINMVNRGEVDFSMKEVMKSVDGIFPSDTVPCYHYCDDWRKLRIDEQFLLWDYKPKMLHLDVLGFPPEVDTDQADAINTFLERGGGLAIGALPNVDDDFEGPILDILEKNLMNAVRDFKASGIDLGLLSKRAMISTRCGLAGSTEGLSQEIHEVSGQFPRVFSAVLSNFGV